MQIEVNRTAKISRIVSAIYRYEDGSKCLRLNVENSFKKKITRFFIASCTFKTFLLTMLKAPILSRWIHLLKFLFTATIIWELDKNHLSSSHLFRIGNGQQGEQYEWDTNSNTNSWILTMVIPDMCPGELS